MPKETVMLKKVISGGQTGAEQAALDVAIKLGIPHGGWIPRGRQTEDGILPDKYQLKEMPESGYAKQAEKNVMEADGTLILSHGRLVGGAEYTRKMAVKHNRLWLHIDLTKTGAFEASQRIANWISSSNILVLNIAGPRASADPKIYKATMDILEAVYFLNLVDVNLSDPRRGLHAVQADDFTVPTTVNEAVAMLESRLILKDRVIIANITREELASLNYSLGDFIRNHLSRKPGYGALLNSCRQVSGRKSLSEADVPAFIIEALWKRLRASHKLRVIK
jgi:hypothetical protein